MMMILKKKIQTQRLPQDNVNVNSFEIVGKKSEPENIFQSLNQNTLTVSLSGKENQLNTTQ